MILNLGYYFFDEKRPKKPNSFIKNSETYLEPSHTSKMDFFFAKTVNGFHPLTTFAKRSI